MKRFLLKYRDAFSSTIRFEMKNKTTEQKMRNLEKERKKEDIFIEKVKLTFIYIRTVHWMYIFFWIIGNELWTIKAVRCIPKLGKVCNKLHACYNRFYKTLTKIFQTSFPGFHVRCNLNKKNDCTPNNLNECNSWSRPYFHLGRSVRGISPHMPHLVHVGTGFQSGEKLHSGV